MAKIDNTKKKGTNKSPVGTMPKDKLDKYKLSGNFVESRPKYTNHNIKRVAKSIRAISTYRMYVHGVTTNVVPSQLKQVAHYFLTPMTRADSDNTKDRKTVEVENVQASNEETSAAKE